MIRQRFVMIIMFGLFTACHSQQAVKTSPTPAAQTASVKLAEAVYFNLNEAKIRDFETIDKNARWLLANRDKVVILAGHCDERGDHQFNLLLGDERSRAVMEALIQKGVPESQLIIMSYGETRPIIKRVGEQSWAQNRRVEFIVR